MGNTIAVIHCETPEKAGQAQDVIATKFHRRGVYIYGYGFYFYHEFGIPEIPGLRIFRVRLEGPGRGEELKGVIYQLISEGIVHGFRLIKK